MATACNADFAADSNGRDPWAVSWSLVETHPNTELAVSRRLTRQEFTHHLFLHEVGRYRGGRRINYLCPAFPRYIFVWVQDMYRRVLETEGVLRFLSDHMRRPRVIDDMVIDDLCQRAPHDILPIPTEQKFRFGDRVRFSEGATNPLFGYEGIYQSCNRPGRATILVPWFGTLRSAEVDEDEIEKVFTPNRQKRHRRVHRGGRRHRAPARSEVTTQALLPSV